MIIYLSFIAFIFGRLEFGNLKKDHLLSNNNVMFIITSPQKL